MGGEGVRGLAAASVDVAGGERWSDSGGASEERRAGGTRGEAGGF